MQKTYPTLYSLDSTGKTRVWWMEQDGNRYRTASGIMGGQIVCSDWTTVSGKNEGKANATTSTEQATKEIDAKYKKQLKTDYHEDINNIHTVKYIEPMSAKNYKDYPPNFVNEPWGVQCKFNGMRCVATKNGLFTRTGETYISTPHIHESLIEFFNKHPDAVLDGELYNYEYRQQLNEINKLVRKTKHITADDLERSKKLISYYIYDGYGFDQLGRTEQYVTRKTWIDSNVVGQYAHIEHVQTHTISSQDELTTIYEDYINDGQEGVILRHMLSKYEHRRSYNLLKFKPEDDAEFLIIDIKPGNGNWAGKAKNIVVKMPNGEVFDAVFKGTMEQGVECLANKDYWIGREVTIKYFGLTGLGTPQFARFDYNDCIKR